jgi:hypothetical protein
MLILDDDGSVFEVPADDCELEADGSGFWYLAAEGEDFEEFYEFVEIDVELEDDLPPSKQV